jgi:hypothetical protein
VATGHGGRSIIERVGRETRISTFHFGLTCAEPIARSHTVKLTAVSGARWSVARTIDAVGLSYQHRWGGLP